MRTERQIVRSGDTGIDSVVRRIRVGDAVARCERLRLLQSEALIGFVPIQYAEVSADVLEVAEDLVHGVNVADAIRPIHDRISVNVALSLVFDLAQSLHRLHSVEHSGPQTLIHGTVAPESVVITSTASVFLGGLTGAVGDPADDVSDLMKLMRDLLEQRARSKEGALLLDRLSALTFTNCRDLARSIEVYLGRQDEHELHDRRVRFATEIMEDVLADEEPTTVGPDALESPSEGVWRALEPEGYTGFDELDLSDENSMTAVDVVPDLSDSAGGDTIEAAPEPIDLERSRVDSQLGPLPQPETDVLDGVLARAAAPEAEAATVVVGNYNVVASIGRGGMGEIYLARERRAGGLGHLVALKVLAAQGQEDEEALDMLLDEAAIMARIDHDNVLRVLNFGRDRGRYYLATEYLEGRPLVRVMIEAYNREQGIDYGVIASIGADAANGLFAAHTATTDEGRPLDVVHRDVSPQNIFVTYRGVSKVIDFGVARATERVSKTEIGLVKGKVAYMSPEQAEGRRLDARSDVFSLGVCLWEMTAGRRLFKKDNEYDTLLAVQSEAIPKPTTVRGDPNPVLDHIILGALERDRDRRTPTARELALQLIDYASGVGVDQRDNAVAELLDRLFGEAAQKERELVGALEVRAATSEEAEALRELSGVSTNSVVRRITWVAEPDGLDDLEGFGTDTGRGRVLDAVQAIQAERLSGHDIPRPSELDGVIVHARDSSVTPLAVTPVEDAFLDAEPTRRLQSALLEPSSGPVKTLPVDEPPTEEDEALDDIELSGSFELIDAGPPKELADAQPTATTTKPKKVWPIAVGVIAVLAIGGAAAAFVLLREEPKDAPALDRTLTVDATTIDPTTIDTATTSTTTRTIQIEPELVEVPTATASSVSETVSIDAFVDLLKSEGVDASTSQGTFLVDDSVGGTLAFDAKAAITRIGTPDLDGFVVETKSKALTSVGWVGRAKGGEWRVRALSINDCPANVGIEPRDVTLRYGGQEIRMRHGGGVLADINLDVPQRATRLEVDPLGLSFGEADESSAAIHCKAGWWGSRVVLRRLPIGRYTLRWIGGGVAQTATLDVRLDGVDGGKLVRRTTGQ